MLHASTLDTDPMRPLLLIQTGEAPETLRARFGGFADWFRAAMELAPEDMRVVRVDAGETLPPPDEVAGATITGSGAMVTDRADWSERTAEWIRVAMDAGTPMFGVCYGHQLMAHALGGEVGWLPAGREIGTQCVTCDGARSTTDAWPASFMAHTTHRQSVLSPPPGARVVARSQRDPHQLLVYGPNALSTQFHPEFSAAHMRAYIVERAGTLREEGLDPEALSAAVVDTPAAHAVLSRFAHAALGVRVAATAVKSQTTKLFHGWRL